MAILPAVIATALAACGGGAKKSDVTPATSATTSGTRPAATPSVVKTTAVGATSPAAGSTSVPTAPAGATQDGGAAKPATGFEATVNAQFNDPTIAASLGSDGAGNIAGGNPADAQHVVVPVPVVTPDPGVVVKADSTAIAAPDPASTEVTFAIDTDASTAGVQTTRTVHVGDTIQVAVILANVPADRGIDAFNFTVDYDKTKIFAATLDGGSSVDRNPALNLAALGPDAGWTCLPAPEGDLDDPGGTSGDGIPATGQAFLSCFTPGTGHATGSLVLATITFHVIAKGSTNLSLEEVFAGNASQIELGSCNPKVMVVIGCAGATITVD